MIAVVRRSKIYVMFYVTMLAWTIAISLIWVAFGNLIVCRDMVIRMSRFDLVPILAAMISLVPTLVYVASVLFLFNAHPTAQFNGGDEYRLSLWSSWVHWYPTLVYSTLVVKILDAGLVIIASFVRSCRRILYTSFLSAIGAGIGLFVLAHTSPSA